MEPTTEKAAPDFDVWRQAINENIEGYKKISEVRSATGADKNRR